MIEMRMKRMKRLVWFFLILCPLLMMTTGCASSTSRLQINATPLSEALHKYEVPPDKRIWVAVGPFADRTGQFRGGPDESQFSAAVSQGAPSIFISLLKETKAFRQVEFAQMSALFSLKKVKNAVKLKRTIPSTPEITGSEMYKEVQYMFTGDITECNFNVKSGGLGIGVAGIGAHGEWVTAEVCTDTRFVDLATCEILSSIPMKMTIYGKKISVGLYKFYTWGAEPHLVEFEAGYSTQDPLNFAVRMCFQKTIDEFMKRYGNALFGLCIEKKEETEKEKEKVSIILIPYDPDFDYSYNIFS